MKAEKGDHQNVARAAQVIETLAGARERGLRLTDVVASTGLGTATIHRLLAGLVEHGFVDFDGSSNRYFVGLRMVSWTAAAIERYGLSPYVDDELESLCVATEDTVYFSLRAGYDAVCVDRREGAYPIKTLTLALGDRRPLGVGAGSTALLAFQEERFVEEVIAADEARRVAAGIDNATLWKVIVQSREAGYAINDGMLIAGMSGIAVPVRNGNGRAVAALSVAAITSRISGERLDATIQLLKRSAAAIETGAADILNTPLARRQSARRG